ncbi:MAG TPA: hypothetical protein V6C86_00375 [Oculatellaceae cyanobacterium]
MRRTKFAVIIFLAVGLQSEPCFAKKFNATEWRDYRANVGVGISASVPDLCKHHIAWLTCDQLEMLLGAPDHKTGTTYVYNLKIVNGEVLRNLVFQFDNRVVKRYAIQDLQRGETDEVFPKSWLTTVEALKKKAGCNINGMSFNSEVWKASLEQGSAETRMLSDFLEKNGHIGADRHSVESKLGAPTRSFQLKDEVEDRYGLDSKTCSSSHYMSLDLPFSNSILRKFRIAKHVAQPESVMIGTWHDVSPEL